jgi:hypothetical protein
MKKLLVEGIDDQHVLWALFLRRNVPQDFVVDEAGGYSNLLKRLPVELKASELEILGVLIDADIDVSARWNAVRAAFRKSGFPALPIEPVAEGLVLQNNDLRIGVWLMPNNEVGGMLEDFLEYLVPPTDQIWPESSAFVDNLQSSANRYKDVHLTKARIHAWLAVQDSPGSPMGQAITKKSFNADGEICDRFLNWIERLFILP